jgi:hypothetical protein
LGRKGVLSDVPADKAFYFNTDVGVYTGKFATNLASFRDALRDVDVRSIEFHMGRGDFEKWIEFLGDHALAREIAKLRGLRGEELREGLIKAIDGSMGRRGRSRPGKGRGRAAPRDTP